ncbi:MAG: ion transporter [Acidimicrobiaceae bacterium]|nr:ion transporter [Gemmatimonadota bacterium]MYH00935.1 ion transporter [Acidimicrobiaceae bacterium]
MTADNPNRSAPSAMARWEQAADVPLLVLALASVPLVVLEDTTQGAVALAAIVANWAIWGLFAVDLAVRVWFARGSRRQYLASHWYDVGIVVLSVLPYFRPLRILRSARALRVLRAARVTVYATSIWQTALRLWGGLAGRAVIVVIPVILAAGSAGVWLVEEDSNGAIDHYGDAAWWAITTVTTVGYGDIAPATTEGRLIAAVLMVTGIAAFGVVTANVAAAITKQRQPEQDISDRLEQLQAAIDELRQLTAGTEQTPI